ncbi:MAG: hypothetical protein JST40_00180 [Armatimonadetes bacterium]|nr:hypothetical protein [Armatimonadota bacterium]
MATHEERESPEDPVELERSIRLGYEHRDVNFKTTGNSGILLTLAVFGFCIMAFGMFWAIDFFEFKQNPTSRSENTSPARNELPPGPLLQSNITTKRDIADLRKAEQKQLTTYGFVDPGKGIIRVPVSRAMDHIAEEGVPTTIGESAPSGTLDQGSGASTTGGVSR